MYWVNPDLFNKFTNYIFLMINDSTSNNKNFYLQTVIADRKRMIKIFHPFASSIKKFDIDWITHI